MEQHEAICGTYGAPPLLTLAYLRDVWSSLEQYVEPMVHLPFSLLLTYAMSGAAWSSLWNLWCTSPSHVCLHTRCLEQPGAVCGTYGASTHLP